VRTSRRTLTAEDSTMRYRTDITAGALLDQRNLLQTRSARTAARLTLLVRSRLALMEAELWTLVRDGSSVVATHACLAATIKQSPLVGDFLDLVVRDRARSQGVRKGSHPSLIQERSGCWPWKQCVMASTSTV
jgi:hypothetical protein